MNATSAEAVADLVRALDVPADGKPHRITIEVTVSPEKVVASYVRVVAVAPTDYSFMRRVGS